MHLSDQIALSPFLRMIVPLTIGILLAPWVAAPTWLLASIAIIVYVAAWFLRKSIAGWWYVSASIFLTGLLISRIGTAQPEIPQGERLLMVAQIDATPYTQGRWQRTTAHVGYYRPYPRKSDVTFRTPSTRNVDSTPTFSSRTGCAPDRAYDFNMSYANPGSTSSLGPENRQTIARSNPYPATEWVPVSEEIQLYIDTSYRVQIGEQITFRGYLNPIDTTDSGYGRLMHSRGLFSRSYLTRGALITRMTPQTVPLSVQAAQVQQAAVSRLLRLNLDETDRNLLATLVAGERRGIDPTLRQEYAVTGVAHILAVSGLHMGFVLLFANLLFGWIVFFRRGHLIKNSMVILFMWGYAVMAGLSAPVIRAALMMSCAQLAFSTAQKGNSYNIVLGVATLMLAVHPGYLTDISFQLSFVAVLSILFFYPRLFRYRKKWGRIPNAILSCVFLGVAAQIGTLPLVAYSFGNIPVISLLINPIVILTSFITICTGLVWLLLPLGFLNPICSFIIHHALTWQNSLIGWAAHTPVTAIRNVDMPGGVVIALYAVIATIAIAIKLREERNEKLLFKKNSRIFAP